MRFGLCSEVGLTAQQLEAWHELELTLDRTPNRIASHISINGVDCVVSKVVDGYALTAMWRFRGDARAITVAGDDYWHVFTGLKEELCKIFKVEHDIRVN